jgi:hypothetical protein
MQVSFTVVSLKMAPEGSEHATSCKYCHVLGMCVIYRRVLYQMFGFIDTLFTVFETTGNYSAVADVNIFQFCVTNALEFSVFISRILVTDFITVSLPLQIAHDVFISQFNSLLAIILQLPTQFNSSAPRHISRQAGVSKLVSILLN